MLHMQSTIILHYVFSDVWDFATLPSQNQQAWLAAVKGDAESMAVLPLQFLAQMSIDNTECKTSIPIKRISECTWLLHLDIKTLFKSFLCI